MWNCIRLQQWGRRKSSRNWNSSVQNVFFLPPAAADFLRLRCSSKRCGRVLKIWHKCHCLNCIQEQSKKKVSVKLTYLQQLRRRYLVHPMNAKFTLEKLRKKNSYRMFSTRFASFKTISTASIVGNVSGITENALFWSKTAILHNLFHNTMLVHQQFKIPGPNFNKCISTHVYLDLPNYLDTKNYKLEKWS